MNQEETADFMNKCISIQAGLRRIVVWATRADDDIEKLKRALPTMPEELKRKTEAELVEYNSKLTNKYNKWWWYF